MKEDDLARCVPFLKRGLHTRKKIVYTQIPRVWASFFPEEHLFFFFLRYLRYNISSFFLTIFEVYIYTHTFRRWHRLEHFLELCNAFARASEKWEKSQAWWVLFLSPGSLWNWFPPSIEAMYSCWEMRRVSSPLLNDFLLNKIFAAASLSLKEDHDVYIQTWRGYVCTIDYRCEDGRFFGVRELRGDFKQRLAFQQWNRG